MSNLTIYRAVISEKSAPQIIRWAVDTFGARRVALASSMSVEDQVLTAMMLDADPAARIFTLDTGRLFEETYATMEQTRSCYGMRHEVYAPDGKDVEVLTAAQGPNCFYRSVDLRKQCCAVRKTAPLRRVLVTVDAWVCGLRREQAVTRTGVEPIEWDETHRIYKINPLYDWTEAQVWAYAREHRIPLNPLQEQGFRSIGCAPCTRAILPTDDIRAGRWWWEEPQHKECGLHGRVRQQT